MKPAGYWIEKLQLLPHPEGGYFAETYRSPEVIPQAGLPARFDGARAFSTGIYFLLEAQHFSALHRIKSDEMWHFYTGGSLDIYVLHPESGQLETIRIGPDTDEGAVFQVVVPAGTWFGARPTPGSEYALVGCTVAPGFDFNDFEMADRDTLTAEFPEHRILITGLTS